MASTSAYCPADPPRRVPLLPRHPPSAFPAPLPLATRPVLKALVHDLHSDPAVQGDIGQDVWAPARRFFELPKARLADLGGAGVWLRWSDGGADDGGDGYKPFTPSTLHLPHLLRVLGPSSLTRYNHVLGRRRILIYSQPPVEAACFLERESRTGWITCTTNAVFLEESQHYDLVIDLTSYAPTDRWETTRPSLQLALKEPDVKLLTELDHILQLDADTNGVARARHASALVRAWTDAWGVYEDVCVVRSRLCSGLWRSNSSNGPSGPRDQWSWAGPPRERSGRRTLVHAHRDVEGRRTLYRPHDDGAGIYDSSDEDDEDGAGASAQPADAYDTRAAADLLRAHALPPLAPRHRHPGRRVFSLRCAADTA
ncbi:hypothetical protein EDB89DRAFT_2072613 [Lactarius sanguifluus]|nr:hypothetical protein EDB89DRAFT_2072613 [Lactarius sanguifluus]